MNDSPNHDFFQALGILSLASDGKCVKLHESLLPACQRVADIPKYHILFLDESLSDYIIKKMYLTEKNKTIPLLMKHCNLNQKEAESFFLFLIYGAYNVNKSMH